MKTGTDLRGFQLNTGVKPVFPRFERHGLCQITHLKRLSGEVFIPGTRFGETGIDRALFYIKIPYHYYIHFGMFQNHLFQGNVYIQRELGRFKCRMLDAQLDQCPIKIREVFPAIIIQVIPPDRFWTGAAIVIDRIIVTHFAKLPYHFRAGYGEIKQGIHGQSLQSNGRILDVIIPHGISPFDAFIRHAFLIMTFHITDQMGIIPSFEFIRDSREVGFPALMVTHGCFGIFFIQIAPHQYSVIGQFFLFGVY